MTSRLSTERRTRRHLILGLGIVALILVLQGIIGTVLERGADARAWDIADNGIDSVEQLSNIVHDTHEKYVLLIRQVIKEKELSPLENDVAALEKEVATLDHDLELSERNYASLVSSRGEAALWRQAQLPLDGFQRGTAEVLALARLHKDEEARAQLAATTTDYDELNDRLVELVRLNRVAVSDALDRIAALQASAELHRWGIRIGVLLVLLGFGWWGSRRIAGYQEELASYAAALESRNRDLDAFAGRVAHDLKNALAPTMLAPSLLRHKSDNPGVLVIADQTERYLRNAAGVIDALLAFSQSAQSAKQDESAALKAVMADVLDELAPLAARNDVSIAAEDIPDLRVRCDAGLLHVALANLCGNAIKYLEGQPVRRVHVSARQEGAVCRIQVEDTGPGIPKDAQTRIFDPFFRVEGTRVPGTGIGLATVRRILDARDGRIVVESDEGRGARFIVWIPVAPSLEGRSPKTKPQLTPPARH